MEPTTTTTTTATVDSDPLRPLRIIGPDAVKVEAVKPDDDIDPLVLAGLSFALGMVVKSGLAGAVAAFGVVGSALRCPAGQGQWGLDIIRHAVCAGVSLVHLATEGANIVVTAMP